MITTVVDPTGGAVASPYYLAPNAPIPEDVLTSATQAIEASGDYTNDFTRGVYDVALTPKPTPPPEPVAPAADKEKKAAPAAPARTAAAPPAAAANPGSAQAIAAEIVASRGWGSGEYSCLVALWNRESGWRVNAANPSGAYGIPQALPGSKMASAGADWRTNAATQIQWGLGYISGRYGTPCGAWAHSQAKNWY